MTKPITVFDIASDDDPCFGHYSAKANECGRCGAKELCIIKQSQMVGKTAKKLLKDNFTENDPRDILDKDKIKQFLEDFFASHGGSKHRLSKVIREAKYSGIFNGVKELEKGFKDNIKKIKTYKVVKNNRTKKSFIKKVK